MSLVPTILDIDRDQNAPQASFGAVIMSSPTRTFRENLSQHVSNQKEMAITAGGSVCMTELPTEIQQHIYRSYFEALDVTVWVSPQPYTTPMGRGVKTTTTFPADNSYFALLLVCRKVYETARNLRSHIDLTIELREYTSSPYLEHLRRAIQEQPQLSRLFKECTRVVLWGGDGEFFQRLRLYLPRLQMLRLVNIEVDSPSISQITPHLGFDSLNELSAFLARSWKFGDNDKLQEYEGLIISRGSWAASACLEAFTGQDFAHTTSAVVSLEGLTTEIVVFRAEYYSVDGTEGEALLVSAPLVVVFALPMSRDFARSLLGPAHRYGNYFSCG